MGADVGVLVSNFFTDEQLAELAVTLGELCSSMTAPWRLHVSKSAPDAISRAAEKCGWQVRSHADGTKGVLAATRTVIALPPTPDGSRSVSGRKFTIDIRAAADAGRKLILIAPAELDRDRRATGRLKTQYYDAREPAEREYRGPQIDWLGDAWR